MGRQLVVCLDGTGNRFDDRPTNVVRLFGALARRDADVLGYYDQGLGTFGLKETLFEWQKVPSRVFGVAFGWGFERVVGGAYRFLAEHWAEGDEIYVFGFSRGAYAARALAGLVHTAGIVPSHQAHLFDHAWAILRARDPASGKPPFALQAHFRSTFGRKARIRLLGLFDTVKSIGWLNDPVVIPYTANNPAVQAVRHAVSIDERRAFFRQHLWGRPVAADADVLEVWFAGVHADIGGGYPLEESRLAMVPLRWMMGEALAHGLKLDPQRMTRQLRASSGHPSSDALAAMHDSMAGPWALAEWLPRKVADSATGRTRRWRPGAMPPMRRPLPRPLGDGARVHRSVQLRLEAGIGYAPPNLPRQVGWVDDDPRAQPAPAASSRRVGRAT